MKLVSGECQQSCALSPVEGDLSIGTEIVSYIKAQCFYVTFKTQVYVTVFILTIAMWQDIHSIAKVGQPYENISIMARPFPYTLNYI